MSASPAFTALLGQDFVGNRFYLDDAREIDVLVDRLGQQVAASDKVSQVLVESDAVTDDVLVKWADAVRDRVRAAGTRIATHCSARMQQLCAQFKRCAKPDLVLLGNTQAAKQPKTPAASPTTHTLSQLDKKLQDWEAEWSSLSARIQTSIADCSANSVKNAGDQQVADLLKSFLILSRQLKQVEASSARVHLLYRQGRRSAFQTNFRSFRAFVDVEAKSADQEIDVYADRALNVTLPSRARQHAPSSMTLQGDLLAQFSAAVETAVSRIVTSTDYSAADKEYAASLREFLAQSAEAQRLSVARVVASSLKRITGGADVTDWSARLDKLESTRITAAAASSDEAFVNNRDLVMAYDHAQTTLENIAVGYATRIADRGKNIIDLMQSNSRALKHQFLKSEQEARSEASFLREAAKGNAGRVAEIKPGLAALLQRMLAMLTDLFQTLHRVVTVEQNAIDMKVVSA